MRRNLSENLDNPRSISEMESEPAYKRRNVQLDDVSEMANRANLSRFEVGNDADNPINESNNSYLHENVD